MGVCKDWSNLPFFRGVGYLRRPGCKKDKAIFTVKVFDLANSHTSLRVLGAREVTIVKSLPKSDIVSVVLSLQFCTLR